MKNDTSKAEMRRARDLLRQAENCLRRAREGADDTDEGSRLHWIAAGIGDRLLDVAGDLTDAVDGRAQDVPARVMHHPIGIPDGEDSGGGFGLRALQVLALCREAWGNADPGNAARLERAMGWICRAWLGTTSYSRAHVVRAVLTHGFDNKDKIVARVNAAMAEDSEAAEILRRHGTPLRLVNEK